MKNTLKVMLTLFCIATMGTVLSCQKDEEPEDTPSPSNNFSEEGIYLGVIGFNDQLYTKQIGLLNSSTLSGYTSFINGLTKGNGTGLYYADYTALKYMKESAKPPKLKNVALVTFTDGLDNISLSNNTYNPNNYNSTSAYRDALHNSIMNDLIHGMHVSAYTIGLKGNDVTDEAAFNETLRKLASSDDNVFQVSNMSEATERFTQIAENLNSISTSVSLGVNVPGGYDEGQKLRFTFQSVSSATAATIYIEATYHRTGNGRTLENISYNGFNAGPTSIASSSSMGAYYHFVFDNLSMPDGSPVPQSILNKILLWKQTSNGGWDKETEFDPASSSTITEDKNSALIMLVLDCTNSLGSDFSKMQQAGKNFITTLASHSSGTKYNISVNASPSNGGSVSGGGSYYAGTTVTLTATPNSGYQFVKWSDGNTNSTRTITVNHNATFTAYFNTLGTVYSTSFENSNETSGWTVRDNDGDGHNWLLASGGNSGQQCYASFSYEDGTALSPDNMLYSPEIQIPSTGTITMEFYMVAANSDYPNDKLSVYIWDENTTSAEPTETYASCPTSWTKKTINLNHYKGRRITIGFRHWDCTDQLGVGIDDFKIKQQ